MTLLPRLASDGVNVVPVTELPGPVHTPPVGTVVSVIAGSELHTEPGNVPIVNTGNGFTVNIPAVEVTLPQGPVIVTR